MNKNIGQTFVRNIYLIIPSYPPCLISPTVEEFQKSLDIVTIEISNNYFADNYKDISRVYISLTTFN
ncbi:unnamed protein product [Rhizophagus irregularis]|nr:unnamed protein product [Rhizophagus irregularis]